MTPRLVALAAALASCATAQSAASAPRGFPLPRLARRLQSQTTCASAAGGSTLLLVRDVLLPIDPASPGRRRGLLVVFRRGCTHHAVTPPEGTRPSRFSRRSQIHSSPCPVASPQSCPYGYVVSNVTFADFGLPSGSCPSVSTSGVYLGWRPHTLTAPELEWWAVPPRLPPPCLHHCPRALELARRVWLRWHPDGRWPGGRSIVRRRSQLRYHRQLHLLQHAARRPVLHQPVWLLRLRPGLRECSKTVRGAELKKGS
jgi:hypothetical protein